MGHDTGPQNSGQGNNGMKVVTRFAGEYGHGNPIQSITQLRTRSETEQSCLGPTTRQLPMPT
jgi:hypothetical protein